MGYPKSGGIFHAVVINSENIDLSLCKSAQELPYSPALVHEAEDACQILKDWLKNGNEKKELQVLVCLLVDLEDIWNAACSSLIGNTEKIRITPLRIYSYDEFMKHVCYE